MINSSNQMQLSSAANMKSGGNGGCKNGFLSVEERPRSAAVTTERPLVKSGSFSLKPTSLESYSSNSSNSCHISVSESISSKSANQIFIPTEIENRKRNKTEKISNDFTSSAEEDSAAVSKSASTSSVFAGLSVLSFSESNSIPSLSSSISYSDATAEIVNQTNNPLRSHRPLIDLRKHFGSNSSHTFFSTKHPQSQSQSHSLNVCNLKETGITSNALSQLLAPYKNKPFYGKEWLLAKLNDFVLNKKLNYNNDSLNSSMSTSSGLSSYLQSSSSSSSSASSSSSCSTSAIQQPLCMVLLGEPGTGKTHLACELKWPTSANLNNSDVTSINKHILSVHFLNWFSSKQNCLKLFCSHLSAAILSSSLSEHESVDLQLTDYMYDQDNLDYFLEEDENDYTEHYVSRLADDFIENVIKPINNQTKEKNYFILIDGIDEAILYAERLSPKKSFTQSFLSPMSTGSRNSETKLSAAEMLLMFINKTFTSFPYWLNLILTVRPCNEKNILREHLTNLKYEKLIMDKCVNVDALLNSSMLIARPEPGLISIIETSANSSQSTYSISSLASKSFQQNQPQNSPDANELCNAAHFANLKDIQTYILKRLDNDSILKKKFNKLNGIEMFNLLLIKSNFCVLYVEKVLDLVMSDYIASNEITNIPATLNGLYLYLIESILQKIQLKSVSDPMVNTKDVFYSILSMCLIQPASFTKLNTFSKISNRFTQLDFKLFETIFDSISQVLFVRNHLSLSQTDDNIQFVLFHASLVDWLTDVKFCSAKYLINLSEAHLMLTFHYLSETKLNYRNKKASLVLDETTFNVNWSRFKYHLMNSSPVMSETCLNYIYLLCESENDINEILEDLNENFMQLKPSDDIIDYKKIFVNDQLNPIISHQPTTTVIQSEMSNESIQIILFNLIAKGDLKSIKQMMKLNPSFEERLATMTDSFKQTGLLVAVKLNNFELVEYLVSIPLINLDHCDNSGWTALRYGAWMGNESVVDILLQNGASVDACDSEGRTALRAAVFSGHEHIVKLLLNYSADVNKCDTDNRSALHVAVYMGHMDLVSILLANGALVNQQDSFGRGILSTVLFSTVSNSQLQLNITQTLIKHNADLNQCDNEQKTPLILAVLENNISFIDLLIQNNADMDAIDSDGHTAITYAVKHNYSHLVDFLLTQNAATHILDREGRSILSLACSVGAKESLRLLMDRGLDEMHRDNFGWTPLHEAAYAGYLDIAEMLLSYGSEIDACDNDGKTSLYYACQQGNLDIVKLLVNNYLPANVNLKSHQGQTPFRVACIENKLAVCEFLLKETRTVEINYLDADGRTTLYCLVCSNEKTNSELIRLLLDHGASANTVDTDGRTCLHVAAALGDLDTFCLLLKYQSNLEAVDNNGSTPLLTAAWNDRLSIIKYLLDEQVCRIDHQDNQGATALSIACQKGNQDIVQELLQHGAQIYASSRNPIKLAHQSGFQDIVRLLQQWSAISYNTNHQPEEAEEIKKVCVPRNSKSVESFRLSTSKQARFKNEKFVQSFTNRCVATPTTFSSYIKCSSNEARNSSLSCRLPTSISASPGTYYNAYAKVEELNHLHNQRFTCNKMNTLNESSVTLADKSDELKSSRFKLVKEKLLRKPSVLKNSESPTTPGNKSVASFRMFISSFNGNSGSEQPRCSQNLPLSASASKLKTSKSTSNNTFMQMIRKKLRFLKSPTNSNYNYSHQNENENIVVNGQMHRSITDTIADHAIADATLTNSISFINKKTNKQPPVVEDDVAHIFNRNSLNDCLNPRCSFRECDPAVIPSNKKPTLNGSNYGSYMLINNNISAKKNTIINSIGGTSSSSSSSNTSNADYCNKINNQNLNTQINQPKRPNCLPLNYFKKETSI